MPSLLRLRRNKDIFHEANFGEDQNRLKHSKFRSSFKLDDSDKAYIDRIGFSGIKDHAADFILKRIAPKNPKNDGKQTPYKGHPVFKAQHATATCCRGCIMKWYKIPKNRRLNKDEMAFVVNCIADWIESELETLHRI